MFSRILSLGLTHRIPAIAFFAFITFVACMGLPRLTIDTGLNSLIPESDPDKEVYERIVREFGSDNRTIVYVRDNNLWTYDKLVALEKLHASLEKLDFVERVESLFTLRGIRGKGGDIDSRIFLPEAPKEQAAIDQARADALYNPLIVGNFISPDGNATALMVSIKENRKDDGFDRKANDVLEKLIAPSKGDFEEVFQIGPPRINAELKGLLFSDLMLLAPLSAFALVLTIFFFLRSGTAALIPLLSAFLSILWTAGMMGWANIPVNILCAMLPSLIIAIGSTEDTHMISTYFHGISQTEENRRSYGTRYMLKQMGIPVFLTILTTALGFGSNIFSNIKLIQDFAYASTFALLTNGLITIVFVPIILSIIGPRTTKLFKEKGILPGLPGVFYKVFTFSNTHFPRSLLIGTALLCAFFLYEASTLSVTNDPMSYFKSEIPLVKQSHRIHEDLSGVKVFFISLEALEDNVFLEPKNVEKLVAIQKFIEKQGVFDRSISIADHLSLINREFHGGSDKYYAIPLKRELIAQYLLFFHKNDLESYVSNDFRRANIVVRHDINDSKILNKNIRELREVVENIAGGDLKGVVVGENLMVNAAAETLIVGQIQSLFMLLLVIFLIMSLMFTSLKGGLISLIPNLIPIILIFGIMGVLGIPLNPGTAMVAAISIGIAIDGTIHLFSRYNELCRRTSDYNDAVNQTVRDESTPMVATAMALVAGFGILIFSNFTLIAQFGALSAATMLFALFSNLLITPIIMSRIRLVGLHQILGISLQKEVFERSPLFKDMTDYQMKKAILISELHEFEIDNLLVEQGTKGRSMYLILSGKAEVLRRMGEDSRSLAVLGPGEIFGEIGYVQETERTADVRALTHVTALRFDYKRLRKDLKFFPYIIAKLNFNISCILGARLANTIGSMSPQERKKEVDSRIAAIQDPSE